MTRAELEEEFQVNRRHIYDYLRDIEALGYVFEEEHGDRERVWKIEGGFQAIKPEPATDAELMAVYFAKAHLTYLAGTPFVQDLESLLRKLEAGLPAKTANKIEQMVQVFLQVQRPQRNYAQHNAVIRALQKALLFQRPVRIAHRALGYAKAVIHTIEPYGLQLFDLGLYLVGHSYRARAFRRFAVERIKTATVDMSAAPFIRRPDYISLTKSRKAFGLIEDEIIEVKARISNEVSPYFKERQWHPTQRLKSLKNGDVILSFQAAGMDEILSWVLSWGSHMKVLAPTELVNAVNQEITAMHNS